MSSKLYTSRSILTIAIVCMLAFMLAYAISAGILYGKVISVGGEGRGGEGRGAEGLQLPSWAEIRFTWAKFLKEQ